MIILTSPAKTMDFETPIPALEPTQPEYLEKAADLIRPLSKFSLKELAKLLGVSNTIAELNHERLRMWQIKHTKANARPALFAYHGDIYRELSPHSYSHAQLHYAQNHVRIISGLYGLLRPLDLIQPYRLEMSTPFPVDEPNHLYAYWQDTLTKGLREEIQTQEHPVVINLATPEYAQVIRFEDVSVPVVQVEFKQDINGVIKNNGILSKHARGMMLDYAIRNAVEQPTRLKKFSEGGYSLSMATETHWSFVRH